MTLGTRQRPSQSGFTLLELVISITLLAFLTVFTSQSIQKALKNKTKMQREIDQLSEVRAALRVMENDIQKAFNYHDINITLHNRAADARAKAIADALNPGQSTIAPGGTPQAPAAPSPVPALPEIKKRNEIIITQFLGGEDSLNFTSLSYQRTLASQRYSDQCEVGYTLGTCRMRSDLKRSVPCLLRRISPIIDLDMDEGGDSTPILENVQQLRFRYLAPGRTPEWLSSWFSNKSDDVRSQGQFPLAVEITVEVRDSEEKDSKPLRMTTVAPIRNPNNTTQNQGQGQTGGAPSAPTPASGQVPTR